MEEILNFIAAIRARALGIVAVFLFGTSVWANDPPASNPPASTSPADEPKANATSPEGHSLDDIASTNLLKAETPSFGSAPYNYQRELDLARKQRQEKNLAMARDILTRLLENDPSPEFKRGALFELALCAQDENQWGRAQQIFSQYVKMFPEDPTVPEVFLRQGILYRQMGAPNLALSKYYSVMSSALSLRLDKLEYYQRVVLQAQAEIADTDFLRGHFADAADLFQRLLKQASPGLNAAQIHYKLIRCLSSLARHVEVTAQAELFLTRFADVPESAEVRFLYAGSLKALGRGRDAMKQVLALLESQEQTASRSPEIWAYWQRRAGNEIANQFYRDGDYLSALEVYQRLAVLDPTPQWELPVSYQIGLVYERLGQVQKAIETYSKIGAREKDLGKMAEAAAIKTVLEMARWRKERLEWQSKAELATQSLKLTPFESPASHLTSP